MRNRFLILFLVMATLFACSSDSMISDENAELQKSTSGKAVERPFIIEKLEGTFILGGSPVQCDNSTGFTTLDANGEGILKYLGRYTLLEEWCFDPSVENDLGTRTITFTAANGNELHGDIKTIEWKGLTFMEEVQIMGGTGRFENATGTFTETVEISDPTTGSGTFTYSAEGTIYY